MKKVFHFLLVIFTVIIISQASLILYGLRQAKGQLSIIWNAVPISTYVKNPQTPDSVKQKLIFIQKVREYAVSELGLNNTENYTTIYDQKGKPVLWVVTGCEPFAFEPKQWKFPVLGSVPYKGFFSEELAREELLKTQEEGYDAGMRTVGGWSTLGWFNDPILSQMLDRSYGDLANLIIHELVHSTIFVRDSVNFNENLATFIAQEGALKFMASRYGENSETYNGYVAELQDEQNFVDHILRGMNELDHLYKSFEVESSTTQKMALKNNLSRKIIETTDTLSLNDPTYLKRLKGYVPNNTYFMSFARYRSSQTDFSKLLNQQFENDLPAFIRYMKEKYPFL